VFRGAVRLSITSLRMVSSQAERRNGSIPRPPCGNRLDARMASGASRDTKLYVYSRRSTVPHLCVPPGDTAIAACQARVHGALFSTHLRDNSFRSLVDVGLNRSHPQPVDLRGFQIVNKTTKQTKNANRNRPGKTTLSCSEPDVSGRILKLLPPDRPGRARRPTAPRLQKSRQIARHVGLETAWSTLSKPISVCVFGFFFHFFNDLESSY